MSPPLTIGRLARLAGVGVETIRYYERIGLVEQPQRPPRGHRRYPASTARRLAFIRRAQRLGFSLDEIRELLAIGDGRCADVRTRAEEKRASVSARIAALQALHSTLDDLIEACLAGRDESHCPIVEALAGGATDPDGPPR